MPLIEDPERMKQIEEEMAKTWTKYRAGDTCRVIKGNVMLNEIVTIKFPYAFSVDGEQGYVTEETPIPFAEGELEFVKQDLYGGKKQGKMQPFDYMNMSRHTIRVFAIDQEEADAKLVQELVQQGYCERIPVVDRY